MKLSKEKKRERDSRENGKGIGDKDRNWDWREERIGIREKSRKWNWRKEGKGIWKEERKKRLERRTGTGTGARKGMWIREKKEKEI